MKFWEDMMKKARQKMQSFLQIDTMSPLQIRLQEIEDYNLNAIKNRIWYRGDSEELQQLYSQINHGVDYYKFWACHSSPGMGIRKMHTGIPACIVDTLSTVTLTDLNQFQFENPTDEDLWGTIAEENRFEELLQRSLAETLFIGDGAFKISFDNKISEYPILEFYPGDQIDYQIVRGRIIEVIFKTSYHHQGGSYLLEERYGYGYIRYALFRGERAVDLHSIPETENLFDIGFGGYPDSNTPEKTEEGQISKSKAYILAIPVKFFSSSRFLGRGKSIYNKKIDIFDALDECMSQWMDALRLGRTKEYIPETLLPRNPYTGEIIKANVFDNRYIATGADMSERANNQIVVETPEIRHESYLATYCTLLDLALQGIISPSTMGIDVKKLDNAEAQREKEKATLYTRNQIVNTMQEVIPRLIQTTIRVYYEMRGEKYETVNVDATFGEYANPSFESQVETVCKAKQGGIMSLEAAVDELYGDSRDAIWKEEEIVRLKTEQGIMQIDEPTVNIDGINVEKESTERFGTNTAPMSTLNGAQIGSLMNMIAMTKAGQLTRSEAINIITATLGVPKEQAERFFENGVSI